ncbi:DUF1800 family protein [Lewinella sp. IMCC34183]|uniref:DUF1800 domain-containing protein n=1 Tax=Lewinella sp. IMCC34183 TaxID=2248762 RepID=UPI000E224838|nr:DUF1800 domain-containing protein [Lewinella sp. IMCC34183]
MSYQSSKRFAPAVSSLTPFSGTWDRQKAAHLLRRTTLGPRIDEINKAHRDGLDRTLDLILATAPVPAPPVKYRNDYDEYLKLGETWVDKNNRGSGRYRGASLRGWYYNNMLRSDLPANIQERMSFFWLNYFAIASIETDPRAMYKHLRIYQEMAVGNLRSILREITLDPRMLICLDGDLNSKKNPNENYARELMELFTLGKGPLAGPGDYTNYTEQDVEALARALTGWKNKDFNFSQTDTPIEAYFDADDHDTGDKQLSPRLGSVVIKNAGADEYKVVLEILLAQEATARNFCRRLYRFFVFHDINPTIEDQVIAPLAKTLIDNNYEIKPVLRSLFGSEHFYSESLRGAVIKGPNEYLGSMLRPFKAFWHDKALNDLQLLYELGGKMCGFATDLGVDFVQPPTISGWKAYYDSPQYYRHWISPALLQRRIQISTSLMDGLYHVNGTQLEVDYHAFLKGLTNPLDINEMISEVALIFLPRPITSTQTMALKETIMGGLEDHEWSMACSDMFANPTNLSYYKPILQRMRRLMIDIFSMAEFQLQ